MHQAGPASLLALGARARNKMAHAHSGKPWLHNVRGSIVVTAGDSSVGRASDCRALQLSDGPWFASGSPDVFHSMLTLLLRRMLTVLDDVIGSRIHAHVSRMVAKHCVQACQTGPLRALISQTARESQQYPLAGVSVCMPHSVGSSSWGQALDTMARFAGGRPGTDLRLQLPSLDPMAHSASVAGGTPRQTVIFFFVSRFAPEGAEEPGGTNKVFQQGKFQRTCFLFSCVARAISAQESALSRTCPAARARSKQCVAPAQLPSPAAVHRCGEVDDTGAKYCPDQESNLGCRGHNATS